LYVGTERDNALDRRERGTRTGRKVTAIDVEAIRLDTRTLKLIAQDFGLSIGHVWRIRHHDAWASVQVRAEPIEENESSNKTSSLLVTPVLCWRSRH
jgi:hypothetical protein